jgi:phi LC3 family holin
MEEKVTFKTKLNNWKIKTKAKFKLWWKNFKIRLVKIFGGFNWKARVKNKMFLAAMVSTTILLLQQLGFNIPMELDGIINSCLTILALLGILSDPTSQGFEDYNAKDLKDERIQKIEHDYNNNGIPDIQEGLYLNENNQLVSYETGEVAYHIAEPINYDDNYNNIDNNNQNNFQQPSKCINQTNNKIDNNSKENQMEVKNKKYK